MQSVDNSPARTSQQEQDLQAAGSETGVSLWKDSKIFGQKLARTESEVVKGQCAGAQRELETWPFMRWSTVWCSRCVIIPLTLVC